MSKVLPRFFRFTVYNQYNAVDQRPWRGRKKSGFNITIACNVVYAVRHVLTFFFCILYRPVILVTELPVGPAGQRSTVYITRQLLLEYTAAA